MKEYPHLISTFLLLAVLPLSCAQSSDKNEASPAASVGPELRWKYETGG
jgi:hypothetical protein